MRHKQLIIADFSSIQLFNLKSLNFHSILFFMEAVIQTNTHRPDIDSNFDRIGDNNRKIDVSSEAENLGFFSMIQNTLLPQQPLINDSDSTFSEFKSGNFEIAPLGISQYSQGKY